MSLMLAVLSAWISPIVGGEGGQEEGSKRDASHTRPLRKIIEDYVKA